MNSSIYRYCFIFSLAIVLGTPDTAKAQAWTSSRPDGHAPLGVMGDHTHEAGEVMISYRTMWMRMDGNRDGRTGIDTSQVVSPAGFNFRVTPTRMPMTMHMLGVMLAPSDRVTLMAMLPVIRTEMDHLTRPGGAFRTQSAGVGDTALTALIQVAAPQRQRVHVNLGLRLPSGSITKEDVTPASAPNTTRLPYPMQLGSGTVDIVPGLTYLFQGHRWSGGLQGVGTLRTGHNDADYRLGHRFLATGWLARTLTDRLSVSARVASENWGDIDGADPAFAGGVAARLVPTVFPQLRAGKRVDVGGGINVMIRAEQPNQLRFGFEVLAPVYQSLNGPQLETDVRVMTGLQFLF